MSDVALRGFDALRYKQIFLFALIAASAIPAVVSILNFEVLNSSVYAVLSLWSLLLFVSGAHVWISLAYYFDRKWLAAFSGHPVIFFAVPAALIVVCTVAMSWHNIVFGLALVYGAITINLWHHARQNWGILSLVAKSRGAEVSYMKAPLVHAWPFFIASVGLYMPEVREAIGPDLVRSAAFLMAAAYIACAAVALWNNRVAAQRDPLVFIFCVALCLYFLPLATLNGKPYALIVSAGAHATQYYLLVLMSLSLGGWRSGSLAKTAGAIAVALVVVVALSFVAYEARRFYGPPAMWDSLWVRLVVGFVTGINLVHFWLDAFIWRFSHKDVRALHGEAFAL
jgi:hypothetical protein